MNRIGLGIALGVAVVVGLVFALDPQLDLALSAPFFDTKWPSYWYAGSGWPQHLRHLASWLIALIAAPAFLALILKLVWPRRPMLIPGRAALLMVVTLALAPGLFTNVLLKDHWGRPRPIDVIAFKGDDPFVPWWDPRGECPKNCSFVAGEPSGAFWTLAVATVTPPPWRAVVYAGALAFGAAVGLDRIAGGGHFFTDVVFAGVLSFLIIWLVHGLLYRWRPTRITDDAVERAIERLRGITHDDK